MPIAGIEQPQILQVDETLRLRKFEGIEPGMLDWYQDIETVYLVDGVKATYTAEKLEQMYRYLDRHGELYVIDVLGDNGYRPVGDVTFWQEDMPIVIGEKALRGKGIGRKVISALVQRGKELGWSKIYVGEIYDFNPGSRKCFESAGFRAYEKTETGSRYCLDMGELL